jgi:hypothetical protein
MLNNVIASAVKQSSAENVPRDCFGAPRLAMTALSVDSHV